jgi:aminoglycoside/choline kinase family phosphotransferase
MRFPVIDDLEKISLLLQRSSLLDDNSYKLASLSGDGSDRTFYRVDPLHGDSFLIVFPSKINPYAMEEARSCDRIGRHLAGRQIAVPEILYYEEETGALIYEFLGDVLLHDLICPETVNSHKSLFLQDGISADVEKKYFAVIDQLIKLQIDGRNGFIKDYCWETGSYNKKLMLARESGYFFDAFCCNFIGISGVNQLLNAEFECLAERASKEPIDYLIHRDFQSRNIMIYNDNIRIIDFQGARFGPLAYDLASLLNDPYAELPYSQREILLDYYIDRINERVSIDRDSFLDGYGHIALLRNLQVLGAFAHLTKVRGKVFFHKYIRPALFDLDHKIAGSLKSVYPVLAELVNKILVEQKWKNQNYN